MKSFQKILLILFSAIGLTFTIGMLSLMYGVPFDTDAAYDFIISRPWLDALFAVFAVFICVCFFLLLVFALLVPRGTDDLVLARDKGSLRFSRQAVESAVRCSFADMKDVNLAKVKAKLNRKPEKTRIYVKLSVNDAGRLAGLTEAVQDKIEAALSASFSVTFKAIHIKVVEFSRENAKREGTGEEAAISRVE